ncbi:ECF transporter S component [Kribbella sandramycini]|uniref:ECF transporter S component n=1 Tax=Kribbella sandramycini TaxID=60450 RepID=A0A7Y4KUN2_9ACTN|nr:energy-coupling factor transport system substrate-specific component [Kribbella sandramycini]NOL39023.1 ECF transporter S component [Kribbella sandramycini]
MNLIRLRPRSTAALLLASLVGVVAFAWPLFWQTTQAGESAIGHTTDAPWLFVLLLPLLVAVVLAELSESGIDAKVVSLLGMLAAVGAALRALGPGTAGLEPGFFLLVLAGRAFGAGFGFVLGSVSLLGGALISGGVGPWMPFQMFACAWVGCFAGLLPRVGGRIELLLLAAYSLVAGVAYGFVMNLWFWPYATFGSDFSFIPGDALAENLHRYLLFVVATSLGWDIPRGILCAVLVLVLGRPVLNAFRRTARKAAFDAPVVFDPRSPHA